MLASALALSLAGAGCSANANGDPAAAAAAPLAVTVTTDTATERRIARFIRVSGTLTPEEEADVAAETPGRIVDTPAVVTMRAYKIMEMLRKLARELYPDF